ncbi:hypothetical protein C7974DRAFT_412063 [Boeremia exigua]|uniref:uncharacterized protein n=1 Tax=Boeremia exigua TaxID=749465 RepID=UPI001E8E3A53|nr:uncharacterized protein C7974DRAFT_412063 [Boeremia exigua]KAH6633033.1 hypothetical protein C7974DRAFT_412063 [Boeremia exigua]
MVHACKKLKKALTFKFNFTFSTHWTVKLGGVLESLLDNGFLTREQKRSREPAGAVVMRRVITVLYHDAIYDGTSGWSATLSSIAALLLLSCLGVMVGDIMGPAQDKRPDLPGLRFADVDVLVTKSAVRTRFKIRSGKGMKIDANKYFNISREALPEGRDNNMDPST